MSNLAKFFPESEVRTSGQGITQALEHAYQEGRKEAAADLVAAASLTRQENGDYLAVVRLAPDFLQSLGYTAETRPRSPSPLILP